jgi:hypothetical protein
MAAAACGALGLSHFLRKFLRPESIRDNLEYGKRDSAARNDGAVANIRVNGELALLLSQLIVRSAREMNKPLFLALGQLPGPKQDDPGVVLPENATPLDFLRAVYCDPNHSTNRRSTAAIAAAPFVHPKLAVVANVTSFAAQMEGLSRQRGRSNAIDAKANH